MVMPSYPARNVLVAADYGCKISDFGNIDMEFERKSDLLFSNFNIHTSLFAHVGLSRDLSNVSYIHNFSLS